jgi:hypothetical protein
MARAATLAPDRIRDLRIGRITAPGWAGLAAGLIALCLYVFGPPGGDAATHLYQEHLLRAHGMQFWDNLWYSGRYSLVNYTLLYYPLVVLVTAPVTVAVATGTAVAAFARLTRRAFGDIATPAIVAATLVFPLQVIAGVYPFILGIALGLAMLVAVQSGRLWIASALAVLTLSAHVLAFGYVLMVLVAWVIADRTILAPRGARVFASVLAICVVAQLLLVRAFSVPGGRYMFDPKDLAAILVFAGAGAALCHGIPRLRGLMTLFVLYAVAGVADFAIPNPVGGNLVRLMALAAVPLILIPVVARGARPRWLAVVVVGAVVAWQAISPVTEWIESAAAPGQRAAYWAPVLDFLAAHGSPDYRVEVVQSKRYWEAYYVARQGYALARGWYRQDDYPANAVLYNAPTPAAYRAWLHSVGVRYVFLADATLDPSSGAEAVLLRSGTSGLVRVAHSGPWTVYALPAPTPIVTPAAAAEITAVSPTTMTIRVRRAEPLTVRVHDTPYWTASGACVATGTGASTVVVPRAAGTVVLRFRVSASDIVRALLGRTTACATPPTG